MNKHSTIFVPGASGLVGSAICRKLKQSGYNNIIRPSHDELDLCRQGEVEAFFSLEKPQFVFLCAAKVGGIMGNMNAPAAFIYDNIAIASNIIHAAYKNNIVKLLFLGSSCIYPKHCPQPMKENHLLSDYLEPTNEPYAIAKIAGIKMCQAYNQQYGTNFISVMPTNLYGPNDNFDLESSHVLPALIRKFHEAKVTKQKHVEIWGTGKPKREFLHVDDLASACLFLMEQYNDAEIINVGSGEEVSIKQLSQIIADIVQYKGNIVFNPEKPDGTPRKRLDVSRLNTLGWVSTIKLNEGIETTYQWFINQYGDHIV